MLSQRDTPNHRVVCHPYATQSRKRTLMRSMANDRSEPKADLNVLAKMNCGDRHSLERSNPSLNAFTAIDNQGLPRHKSGFI